MNNLPLLITLLLVVSGIFWNVAFLSRYAKFRKNNNIAIKNDEVFFVLLLLGLVPFSFFLIGIYISLKSMLKRNP